MKKASWKKWLPRLLAHTCPDIFESGTSLPDSKFPRLHVSMSIFKSNWPVHTYPTRIRMHSSTASGNIGKRAYVEKRAKFASCSALCHDSRFYRSNYDRIRTKIKEKCEEQGSFTRNEGCHLK